jgi:hypothetical protein
MTIINGVRKKGRDIMTDENNLPFRTNLILEKRVGELYAVGHREHPNSLFLIQEEEEDIVFPLVSNDKKMLEKGLRIALGTGWKDKMMWFDIYKFNRETNYGRKNVGECERREGGEFRRGGTKGKGRRDEGGETEGNNERG